MNEKQIMRRLGQRIVIYRKYRCISFVNLAKKAKISKGTLSQIENGKGNPSISTLFKITSALRVPLLPKSIKI